MNLINQTLDQALGYISEKVLDVNSKQALCLSNLNFLDRMTLGSINRNINPSWVSEMKKSILDMQQIQRRTTITVCIDIRDIEIALTEGGEDFKVVIIDAQHRWLAMKEIKQENPDFEYQFWLVVYIVNSEEETKKLLFDLDRRLDITPNDKQQIQIRQRFIDAFSLLTRNHEKRRCIQRSKNLPILRDPDIMRVLHKMNLEEIKEKIKECALHYKQEFIEADLPKHSALYLTINDTKLYQLIHWQSGSWIKKMLIK